MIDIQALRQRRGALLDEATGLLDAAEGADRAMNDEERQRYNQLLADADELGERIQRAEDNATRQATSRAPVSAPVAPPDPNDNRGNGTIGLDPEQTQRYSLVRAIRAAADHDWRHASFELECSQRVADQIGQEPELGGFYVPDEYMRAARPTRVPRSPEARDLLADSGEGPETIATDLLVGSFIDILRNLMVVRAAGATVLAGLRGDVAIPRQTGAAAATWVTEGNPVSEQTQAFDQVALSPNTLGAFTDYSRKLLLQSSLDIEAFVRGDLATANALKLDLTCLHGSGSGAEPQGVRGYTGVGAVECGDPDGAAPDWGDIVNLEREVAVDNALLGRLAYITNTKVRAKLKTTEKASSTAQFVWDTRDPSGPLNGYPAFTTNQVLSNLTKGGGSNLSAIFFGNWADVLIGLWGAVQVIVDPYTQATSSLIRVVTAQEADIDLRHPESFAVIDDAVTT